ncbi:hypothetical protein [Chlamydia vaughanii]|uniref:hypothetical protein n=1 Tax=Chlamydia vaughanii TaxID=3112552 RepID=UPI0032B1B660
MFINKYGNNLQFLTQTSSQLSLFRFGFVREAAGIRNIRDEWDPAIHHSPFISSCDKRSLELMRPMPILGTILGLGRVYSVWSTKDSEDDIKNKILHTVTGIVEILGLGIVLLVAKILVCAMLTLFRKLASCCRGSKTTDLESPESPRELSDPQNSPFANMFSTLTTDAPENELFLNMASSGMEILSNVANNPAFMNAMEGIQEVAANMLASSQPAES